MGFVGIFVVAGSGQELAEAAAGGIVVEGKRVADRVGWRKVIKTLQEGRAEGAGLGEAEVGRVALQTGVAGAEEGDKVINPLTVVVCADFIEVGAGGLEPGGQVVGGALGFGGAVGGPGFVEEGRERDMGRRRDRMIGVRRWSFVGLPVGSRPSTPRLLEYLQRASMTLRAKSTVRNPIAANLP